MEIPQVRKYCAAISAHYNKELLDSEKALGVVLDNPPLFTKDQLDYFRAMAALGERESIEPTGYDGEAMNQLAETVGHKRGYLTAVTYLIGVAEGNLNNSGESK